MMMLKRILAGTVLTVSLGLSSAQADSLGFEVGGGVWQPDASGTFQHGGANIDLKNDLFLKDGENQGYAYAVLEHPIPLIPNIKISKTSLNFTGTGTVGTGYTFGSTAYAAGTAVTTEMNLDHTETTLYYSLLDNWINVDLGLTAKTFSGKTSVTAAGVTETTNIDKTIPLVYLAAGVELPFINSLFFGVESSFLSVGNHKIQDTTVKFSYTTSYFLGFELGYRTFSMKLDNLNNNTSDMEFTGSFANLFLHF